MAQHVREPEGKNLVDEFLRSVDHRHDDLIADQAS